MELWGALIDILVLLLAALALGAASERLGQSAILGYLAAGTLLGPNALNFVLHAEAVSALAELGVALLLFTIGLEFSWRRLRRLGAMALGGGSLQVAATGLLTALICAAIGLGTRAAIALGAMIALSSTACVLRVLVSRAEIDAVHGRNALGILLLQDLAVIPLVLIVTMLGGEGSAAAIALGLGRAVLAGVLLVGALHVALNYVAPLLLRAELTARNRELPILLAVVAALGSAWGAHSLGVSPALGAFLAGILLGESPFAVQIRADVGSLRTLFVTLFFGSIGMLGDPRWAAEHAPAIVVGVAAVVAGKAIVAAGAVRLFGSPMIHAAATGLCLAQVGEFSFVLAESARAGGVIDEDLFKFVVSVTIATLFLTPMLCASAPRLMRAIERADAAAALEPRGDPHACAPECYVVIIGFGPAGRRVAERLVEDGLSVRVVDLNPRTASASSDERVQIQVGDAATVEVLEHVGTAQAAALIVTIPDPAAARLIVRQSKRVAPATPVIARARYHLHRDDLREAGADEVVDEEWEIGLRIAEVVRGRLRVASAEAPRAD